MPEKLISSINLSCETRTILKSESFGNVSAKFRTGELPREANVIVTTLQKHCDACMHLKQIRLTGGTTKLVSKPSVTSFALSLLVLLIKMNDDIFIAFNSSNHLLEQRCS